MKGLKTLDLIDCKIGDKGVQSLSVQLMEAKFLNKLYITRNNITEIGANHLAMSLSSPTCNIKKLRLNKN